MKLLTPREFLDDARYPLAYIWDGCYLKLQCDEPGVPDSYVHSFVYDPHSGEYLFRFVDEVEQATTFSREYCDKFAQQLGLLGHTFQVVPVREVDRFLFNGTAGWDGSLN